MQTKQTQTNQPSRLWPTLRWLAILPAAWLCYMAVLYSWFFVMASGQVSWEFSQSMAGLLCGLLAVLSTALLAPRDRLFVAKISWLVVAIAASVYLRFRFLPTVLGGALGLALVAWWMNPRRTRRKTARIATAAGLVLLALAGVAYARYVDWPARPDDPHRHPGRGLGADAPPVTAFYYYNLGGLIDWQYLWRIDAPPDAIAQIVTALRLRPAVAVPDAFWRMPPHYWPRSLPPGAAAWQSRWFTATERGADGLHYFLVHDPARNRAYVWVHENF